MDGRGGILLPGVVEAGPGGLKLYSIVARLWVVLSPRA